MTLTSKRATRALQALMARICMHTHRVYRIGLLPKISSTLLELMGRGQNVSFRYMEYHISLVLVLILLPRGKLFKI